MSYLLLFVRGFIMVGLVSWQTRAIQDGDLRLIALGAFLIGCFWYTNVIAAVEQLPFGFIPYAGGSTVGALAAVRWYGKNHHP
jgi:hypothetical protein